jgi:cytochrome d ubiquinol oxidase subunit I
MLTERGVSTAQGPGVVLASMVIFTLVYTVLTVVWGRLIWRYMVEGAPGVVHDDSPEARADEDDDATDRPLSFAY